MTAAALQEHWITADSYAAFSLEPDTVKINNKSDMHLFRKKEPGRYRPRVE